MDQESAANSSADNSNADSVPVDAFFVALAEQLADPMLVLSMNDPFLAGKIVYVNAAALRVYGYTPEEMIGQPVSFLASANVVGRVPNRLAWVSKVGNVAFESQNLRRDGSVFPVEVSARMVTLAQGEFVVAVVRDLTAKKIAAAALEEMQNRFQAFMDNSPAVAFMKEADGRYLYANNRLVQTFPERFKDWKGKTDFDIWPPNTAKALRDVDIEVLRTGKLMELIENVPDENHEWLVYKFPLFNTRGEATILAGMAVDVTALRRTREELRQSREGYRMLMDQAADGILVIDKAGYCIDANSRLCQLFSQTQDALLCRHLSELIVDERQDRCAKLLEDLRAENKFFGVWRLRRASQQPLHVEVHAKALSDGRLQAIVRDMSERLHAEERERQRQAEIAHVARLSTLGQMVAGIAHELGQPLYAINNYALATSEIFKSWDEREGEVPLRDDLEKWIREISTQANRAREVIRRLANFTRKTELKRVKVCARDLMREAADFVGADLRKQKVSIEYCFDPDNAAVRAEPILIEQVIVNLIRNACEAVSGLCPERKRLVLRSVRREHEMELSVVDRGTGIAPQDFPKIFDSFYTSKPNGMGLGLAISRSIVEAHGGRLWVENNAEEGATFFFTLPLERPG